jgi:hypothetical protein
MSYDDKNPEHRKAVDEWLTRPRKNLNRVVYDPAIDEEKTHHNLNLKKIADDRLGTDPGERIIKATSMYDDNPTADKALRKLLIEKMNKGKQLDSDEVRFLMESKPKQKEATPKQMAELKKKMDKYKYIHGEPKQKPFKKRSAVLNVPPVELPKVETPKPQPKQPEEPLEIMIARRAEERLKKEQEEWDQQFGTGGIPQLKRPI